VSCSNHFPIPNSVANHQKAGVIEYIHEHAPVAIVEELEQLADQKQAENQKGPSNKTVHLLLHRITGNQRNLCKTTTIGSLA